MSVGIINSSNINQNVIYKRLTDNNVSIGAAWENPYANQKAPKKVKVGVFFTTLAGVVAALALITKGKGYSLNPTKIAKTAPKNWGIWKCDYKEKAIMKLAAGSVGGGLLGGALLDKKENLKAKVREAVIQVVGNITVPLLCVSGGIRLFNKYESKILKAVPEIKGTSKLILNSNKAFKNTPVILATTLSLIAGIFLGNKTGNTINEKIFGIKDDRKIKPADFSPHVDDMCLAISLVSDGNIVGKAISRIIPAALMVAGVSAGIAQEKPENKQK